MRKARLNIFYLTIICIGAIGLLACKAAPPAYEVVQDETGVYTKNSDFMIIRSRPNDSFEAIAQRYYGDSAEAFRLTKINPPLGPSGGQLVSIPLRMTNPANIFSHYYKTIPILCYHQFTDSGNSHHPLVLQQEKFREQLQYLKDNNYQVLRLDELESYLDGKRPIPDKSVVLTIDDGYRSIYTVAYPLLKEFNFPVTVFLYTDFIGGKAALTWQQVKELRQSGLFDFQSHSKTHASLATLPNPDPLEVALLEKEIVTPHAVIEKRLGFEPVYFAFPYGDTSDAAVELLQQEGYRLAFTVQAGGNPVFADRMRLRRAMIYDGDTMETFINKLTTKVAFQ